MILKIPGQFQDKRYFSQIPGVIQDQDQIQGLFQVCANPGNGFKEIKFENVDFRIKKIRI